LFEYREEDMRIIKLSDHDKEFPDRASVDTYFANTLPNRNPVGQFFLTSGRIAHGGIAPGEPLIFSYKTEIVYAARAASGRLPNSQNNNNLYPFYFVVDMATISVAQGMLSDVEHALAAAGINRNIVRTQGWPIIHDLQIAQNIWDEVRT
jgi:hypothetical protein